MSGENVDGVGPSNRRRFAVTLSASFLLFLSACQEEAQAPFASSARYQVLEDRTVTGQVNADGGHPGVGFEVISPPEHGQFTFDQATGRFTYRPHTDYFGSDQFSFVARDGTRTSQVATVVLSVAPENDPPVAQDQVVTAVEDSRLAGQLGAFDVEGSPLTFAVTAAPAHGLIWIDPWRGTFEYFPLPDFNGGDEFRFTVSDGTVASNEAAVSISVAPVDDPPRLPFVPDQTNSAEVLETFIALPLRDADGETIQYAVAASDEAAAAAQVDATGTLIVTPRGRGRTQVTLVATDGISLAKRVFDFTVTDVTKVRRFNVAVPRDQAVSITNTSDHDVTFELHHNGHRLATTGDQMVQEVRDLPDEVPGEPFERKLWRYVRDGSFHFDPLTAASWQHDPLLFMNSVGFGYCDDVTAVYVALAQAAGYPARGWDLRGHAVPEIQVGGRWVEYDPDLAVYYLRGDGSVAGVEDLAQDPSLFSAPIAVVSSWGDPYSPAVEAIYTSSTDNGVLWPSFYAATRDVDGLHLPPGGRISYPGQWAAVPITVYDTVPRTTAQLKLDLPAGFSGLLDWPLVTWDVQGAGRVRLGGAVYQVGSMELTAALQDVRPARGPAAGLEILEASSTISIVYLLNPAHFDLGTSNVVVLRALDAWALQVGLAPISSVERVVYDSLDVFARPR